MNETPFITEEKDFCQEHTKPVFNEHKLMNVHNLYVLHTFMSLFKIMKYHTPISVHNLFQISPRHTNLLICLPKIHLSTSKENFLFKASHLWNNLINIVLNKCKPMKNGLLVPGSMVDSDMGASIAVVKFKVKMFLLKEQEHGDQTYWTPRNFYGSC